MKILLVGNGGREHAIAQAFARSARLQQLFVFATKLNPGIEALAHEYHLGADLCDHQEVLEYAQTVQPDMVFIGPDDPIGSGLADSLDAAGFKCVAPFRAPAKLESSKYFTRELVEKHFIPGNPRFRQFSSEAGVMEFLQELGEDYVVKGDGLAGGKGVKVAGDHLRNHEEALSFVKECLSGKHSSVVIEEKLEGVEFSLMAFVDGTQSVFMPAIQDHKRAYDGDEGPNTGGMGTYSCADHSLPFLEASDIEAAKSISEAVVKAVKEETGQPFIGILYGGFMATKDGVKLIEYNTRFGDPEALNALPLLETDFVDVCEAMVQGTLGDLSVSFASKATVCLYAVPEGYPEDSLKGEALEISDMPQGVECFYSSVDVKDGQVVTTGSRSLGIVGIADDLEEARQLAVEGLKCVRGKIAYRTDIGTTELVQKRVDMMKRLRS